MVNQQWMSVDTSFWSNTFAGIKIRPTQKLFYKKFLWRLVVHIPSGNLIYSKMLTMSEALEHRRAHARSYNWAGSWLHGHDRGNSLRQTDANLLTIARNIKHQYGNTIRIRVEEPTIQFYADSQETLKAIAHEFTYPGDYRSHVREINGPESDQQTAILLSGAIIRHKAPGYRYKVILRDGRYTVEIKKQVLAYLDNLDDQIRLTPKCREMLASPYIHIWGVFFYTDDPDLTIMLRMIAPDLVGNIHELIVLDK
jgi:hypothetical protein